MRTRGEESGTGKYIRRSELISNKPEFSLLEVIVGDKTNTHLDSQDSNVLLYIACVAERRRLGSVTFRLEV